MNPSSSASHERQWQYSLRGTQQTGWKSFKLSLHVRITEVASTINDLTSAHSVTNLYWLNQCDILTNSDWLFTLLLHCKISQAWWSWGEEGGVWNRLKGSARRFWVWFLGRGLSVLKCMISLCLCSFARGTKLIGYSKSPVSVNGCLSLYACAAMNWV